MPGLIEAAADGVLLNGGRCRACGYIWFPFQSYGCESCGAMGDELVETALSPEGAVEASATVHLHGDPQRPAPFVVAAVRLDAGPLVRALADVGSDMASGTRVTGRCEAGADDTERARSFRFVPVSETSHD